MYKKFILSLLLFPMFLSNEFFCSDESDEDYAEEIRNVTIMEFLIHAKEAQERLIYMDAKIKFRECLQSTTLDCERNEENVPTECEKTALAFIICGGVDEVFNMTRSFKPRK